MNALRARWNGKVAVITGASAGIGAAISEKLVEANLQVVGIARRAEKLNDIAKRLDGKIGKFYPFVADISKEDQLLNAFEWVEGNVGSVNILINNAGIKRKTNLIEGNTTMWKEVIDTNVLGLCIATREAVKYMRRNNIDGHIVHLSSVTGHKVIYFPEYNVYPASKYAVNALTETLRRELISIGSKIKITSISPGVVDTETREVSGIYKNPEQKEFFMKLPHLKPEDIADAVVYTLGTPPHVQIHDVVIKPNGEPF